ncbi:hypothetical protein [Scleromatobacter humisilvae]|uniref:Uncharacterized protein n=1 Tax=Scleromatobacter humisilvae TaxID=2897159 RepID=A0A9X1YKI7_9BURK|nr:hypothetical protein [Scleromatobacter humisilvae]MCK9687863.1 hypothetical protein [Scleromatobacter humisilvae]
MRRITSWIALGAATTGLLAGCGDGYDDGYWNNGPGGNELISYVGTTGVFAAWADSATGYYAAADIGSYAGKRQSLHGSIDFMTGQDLMQPAGVEIYKTSDGHIRAIDLASFDQPHSRQISSETAATVDDTCSLTGTQVAGAHTDYAGVYFAADLQNPVNSAYFYRLPGLDGACNTADDVVHMVRTGMSSTDAPITVTAMPIATVHSATGSITGFVIKSGATLALVDNNFANPVTLGTFASPVGVAVALPVGTTQGYPTAQLFLVDGNIVRVNYASAATSAPLFTIPAWTPTSNGALFAASPTALYVAVNTAAAGGTPESASIYSIPADGSSVAAPIDTETAHIDSLVFPVAGTNVVWGEAAPTYTIRAMAQSGGSPFTVVSSTVSGGTFNATATAVYYTTWASVTDSSAKTVTRTNTSSGISGLDGSVIQAPLANSTFAIGGEQQPWPDDTTTTATPFETMIQIQNLSPVTASDPANGYTYTVDGVSGGTLVAIPTSTNVPGATIGTLSTSHTMWLTGTFRDAGHTGFIEGTNVASTANPSTRALYLLNTHQSDTLIRITPNL